MIIKQLVDEDFVNYKKPSMFIGFPKCSWKCEKECGQKVCQNSALSQAQNIEIDAKILVDRYLSNPITSAIVCGGLEPFDSFSDLLKLVECIRSYTMDDIIIYSGYTKDELENGLFYLENYNSINREDAYNYLKTFHNIIVKFGRFIPWQQPHYDSVLGVMLASDNQYAERIS